MPRKPRPSRSSSSLSTRQNSANSKVRKNVRKNTATVKRAASARTHKPLNSVTVYSASNSWQELFQVAVSKATTQVSAAGNQIWQTVKTTTQVTQAKLSSVLKTITQNTATAVQTVTTKTKATTQIATTKTQAFTTQIHNNLKHNTETTTTQLRSLSQNTVHQFEKVSTFQDKVKQTLSSALQALKMTGSELFLPPEEYRKPPKKKRGRKSKKIVPVSTPTFKTKVIAAVSSPFIATKKWFTKGRFGERALRRLRQAGKVLRNFVWALISPFIQVVRKHPFITFFSIFMTVTILGGSYVTYEYIFKDLPEPEDLLQHQQILTTKILDRNGELLYRIYKDENRTLIPLSQVPPYMIQATIAIEDKEFFNHHGFSVRGIVRAAIANIKGDALEQGGSTITQQLVKNTLLSSEKTWQRKIREIIVAVLVDGRFTKEEILEMYFNQVAYGGSTYGIEEAAHRYFNKAARDLTLAEAALLAGLPQAPSVYSPFGPTPELAYERQAEVLRRMTEDGYITPEEAEAAKQEKLTFKTDTVDIKAPHFVMYVKKLLAQQYGEDVINQGGLEVRTTLDLSLQNETQKIVTDEVNTLERLRIKNGASLVTNPKTGEVLAMVGSKNYFDFQNDGQVNVTLRPRQPGSSIKPLTYALAFERDKNPSTLIDDTATSFMIPGSQPYSPKNYDGKFHGKVTLRQSLGSSYNIPAVKLAAQVGVNNLIEKGEQMGISTWLDRSRYGLSLTLGGGEVLMIDMAKLYGTFANQGYTVDINPILEVKNSRGEVLYQNTCALSNSNCPKRKTLDTRVAYQITDVLKDNNARIPAFGPQSFLTIPNQEVAVKTGTTNNLRDNWTIGYTSERVVTTWVGNNDNTPMSYVASGVTGASPIWNSIIKLTLDDENPHRFPPPEGLVKVQVCSTTGTLMCRGCPSAREEYYIPGTEPKTACNPAQFYKPRPTAAPNSTPPNRDQILEGVISP